MKNIAFVNCDLSDSDFTGAQMESVLFKNCNLKNTQFSQTKLQNVSLRGSSIEDIHLGKESVIGLIVDTSQALYLSSIFGLRIEE